ncbi:hypothetical protein TYRP_017661 [Tyrophagus putrescentiae]|nr:hypothetical protein TYRP_017661 [Tyrophagus putrescentiae]
MKTTFFALIVGIVGLEHALAFHCPVPNGFFPHSNQHKFIRCVNGVNYEYDCPSDLVWNHSKGQCDWTPGPAVDVSKPAKPAHPEFTANREARLNCPTSDGFFPHPNAHKFFRCVRGIDYEYICPADLLETVSVSNCCLESSTSREKGQLFKWHLDSNANVADKLAAMLIHPNAFWQVHRSLSYAFSKHWRYQQVITDHELVGDGVGCLIIRVQVPHRPNDWPAN